ncbi:uncharacterized protein LOC126903292 [Daktulosphaira vitifoliae]|uniref:uncharacterized protein LOC126903292 n=1 Tax=Daktulosphaira vitifoliae TaxID=58002 RepID=UPI0021AA7DE8|nr:uncharacterized protein LOC126903292 [Daktulosphaira vitifoliae]XP_050537357.1 uncharacterized protein LOC126903292 [Daktulosphaira vitifoliae]XP_050537358.1 uncharacterized protein LOC126903292 [Daktulosphaira vitifoliae]XP_050537359.1 uncharacterized protein LOC126903292 [Daktulosphaira vitifoliae]XP_050537360.1 uncharacterized protein LOC126903292 [Daktulosphaira vitifoliae]
MKSCVVLFLFSLILQSAVSSVLQTFEQWEPEPHPCQRECVLNGPSKTCQYHFKVEWYYTMSKACYDCPYNMTDCFRPDCIPADGVEKPIIVVNRSLPGPSIQVCLGDTVIVDVENGMMEESTSIHWHGHHQRNSPYMDGVPYVTQCPVPPHSTFRYMYVADNEGTHFWHSHSGCQRGDGVFGSFIVRGAKERDTHKDMYDVDEHVITVVDWLHELGIRKFLAHHHGSGNNKPDTLLINGKGRNKIFEDDGIRTPLENFVVTRGKRYRFRVINAGFLNCPIVMSIDNHTFTVIATDGYNVQPVVVDSFVSYAGERWDFVLEATAAIGNYWMRFRGLMDCDERFNSAFEVAILHYKGADDELPPGEPTYENSEPSGIQLNALNKGSGLMDSATVSELEDATTIHNDPRLLSKPDVTLYMSYDFYSLDNPYFHKPMLYGFKQVLHKTERLYTPQINKMTFKLQSFPLLSQREMIKPEMSCDSIKKNCSIEFCECTNIIKVPLGSIVELFLIDKGITFNANHPFHLHGHPFRVIAIERVGNHTSVEEIEQMDREGKIKRNLLTAPLKDTVTVPDGGFTIVRFIADNPGYWLFHCHIEFHVEVGMATVFKIGEDSDMPLRPLGFPKCGNYDANGIYSYSEAENELSDANDFRQSNVLGEGTKDSSNDMLNTINKWWPFIGGAHPYVSSSSVNTPISINFLSLILLTIFYYNSYL